MTRRDLASVAGTFAGALRASGLAVPHTSTIAFASAIALLGLGRGDLVLFAAQSCFARSEADTAVVTETFRAFFAPPIELPDGRLTTVPPVPVVRANEGSDEHSADDMGATGPGVDISYSDAERLGSLDFAACSDAELEEAARIIADMRRKPALRRGRRYIHSHTATQGPVDLRATIARSMQSGGELMRLERRARATRSRPVVFLIDASGSMSSYTRNYLRFAHATMRSQHNVETFTFSTQLTRVTRSLEWVDPTGALSRVSSIAPDLEGGTRLGACLASFNAEWGCGGIARGAVVVICSDGWDQGDPTVVESQMARLARVAHHVIWVNPLKATEGYQPLVRAMAAALPSVDTFISGHSLDALAELAGVMTQ